MSSNKPHSIQKVQFLLLFHQVKCVKLKKKKKKKLEISSWNSGIFPPSNSIMLSILLKAAQENFFS